MSQLISLIGESLIFFGLAMFVPYRIRLLFPKKMNVETLAVVECMSLLFASLLLYSGIVSFL